MYSPWGWRGVCRVLNPTASLGAGGVSRDPNTWLPGGAAPCAGSRGGTASDWHVPPPGTPAWGVEGGREREGGRKGREGSWRKASGSVWGWTGSWSVTLYSTRVPNSSHEREEVGHEEDKPRKTKSPERERRRIQGDKHPHPLHTDSAAHTHPHKGTLCFLGLLSPPNLRAPYPHAPCPPTLPPGIHMPLSSHTPCPLHMPTHPPTHPAPHPAFPPCCEGARFLLFGNDTLGLT